MARSLDNKLDVPFGRHTFDRIGGAFLHCLSFLIILQRTQREYQGQGPISLRTIPGPDGLVREAPLF